MKFDYLIVGAGPFGAAFARTATDLGKKCLVIDRREHIAGNTFTRRIEGIHVHMYGAHIFHTDCERIWEFVNQFGTWLPFHNNPRVRIGDKIFSFPINLHTLNQLWGVTSPAAAREKLEQVRIRCKRPRNAEEWLLDQVGEEIYELFFRGYTRKQWFKEPSELPPSIIQRLPFRLTYDDSYFSTRYQAIPQHGYTGLFANMLEGIEFELGCDFYSIRDKWRSIAEEIVFTGPIDQFFDFEFGKLEYRSLRFEQEIHEGDFQGHAVINYPEESVPWIRIVEHKHFYQSCEKNNLWNEPSGKTVVSRDIPLLPEDAAARKDPQYPIRDHNNLERYSKYKKLADSLRGVYFGGRLGEYQYYDMDQAIGSAISKASKLAGNSLGEFSMVSHHAPRKNAGINQNGWNSARNSVEDEF